MNKLHASFISALDKYSFKTNLIKFSFDIISRLVLDNFCPKEHNFKTEDCWGALYRKGHYIKTHHHWPSALSWTYYLKTSPNTEPFVFVGQEKEYPIYPEEGDLIIFPSQLYHSVDDHMKEGDDRYTLSFNSFPSGKNGSFGGKVGMEIDIK